MILTKGVDEGPVLAQEEENIPVESWPIRGTVLDELLALFIILEASEDLPLLIGDDVADIVAQPLPVGPLQLFLKGLLLAGFVFVG